MDDESSKERDVCFVVNTTRGDEALMMCLSSVLLQNRPPDQILVNFNGPFPAFGKFYLEQLAELARHRGVAFAFAVSPSLGVRAARQETFKTLSGSSCLMWMGDDDVVYVPSCLDQLLTCYESATQTKLFDKVYVQGSKPDLNNRRAYGDFKSEIFTSQNELAKSSIHEVSPNRFYSATAFADKAFATSAFDTGNVLLDPFLAASEDVSFDPFPDSAKNVGGEDTLFGAMLRKKGWTGLLAPSAIGYHLESPVSMKPWDVMKERGEMILRSADALGLDKDELKKSFAPWVYE